MKLIHDIFEWEESLLVWCGVRNCLGREGREPGWDLTVSVWRGCVLCDANAFVKTHKHVHNMHVIITVNS